MHQGARKHYAALLPQKGLCFDVGANAGRISEALLELGHTVVAFEPQKECVRELRVRCDPWRDRLRVEEVALGEKPDTMTMFLKEYTVQSSLKPGWGMEDVDSIQVPVSTLDLAIARFGMPQYCKIDVEGWEVQVLSGLTHAIPLISFEYHQEDGMMQDAYACLDRLASLGAITLNLTTGESSDLVLPEWVSMPEFKSLFEGSYKDKEAFAYGDIYVRMARQKPEAGF